jgi:hypothetical protein
VIAVKIAVATACEPFISSVAKTYMPESKTLVTPRINGIKVSLTLLFLIATPMKYKTGIKINNSGLMNSR